MKKNINLRLYECSDSACEHSFYTSSDEVGACPKCGENTLNYVKEEIAVINDGEVESEDETIVEGILNFFQKKGISLPSSMTIIMDFEYNNNEPWEYLSGIELEGEYENKEDLEEELKTFVNGNYTISEMKENKTILFPKA